MREIKFRAWEPSTKKMAIPKLLEDMILKATTFDPDRFQWDSDIVMMQYIGLKDTNGVEIYEGDILTFTNNTKLIGEVKYTDRSFECEILNLDYDDVLNYRTEYIKVIGNIHQNPELL